MNTNKIINIIRYIGGIHKSIYVNFRLLPFRQAIKLPIIVSRKTILISLSGNFKLKKVKTGIIRIGFGSIKLVAYAYDRTILNINGTIICNGKIKIGMGSKIEVGRDGILEFGNNFINSASTKIICHKNIRIGNNCLVAWDSLIMDTDYHSIMDMNNNIINKDKEIVIDNNVWIGAKSIILKGSRIPSNSIVAANSLINKKFEKTHTIIGGNPVKILKENVSWKE